jgi:hypothetical protein
MEWKVFQLRALKGTTIEVETINWNPEADLDAVVCEYIPDHLSRDETNTTKCPARSIEQDNAGSDSKTPVHRRMRFTMPKEVVYIGLTALCCYSTNASIAVTAGHTLTPSVLQVVSLSDTPSDGIKDSSKPVPIAVTLRYASNSTDVLLTNFDSAKFFSLELHADDGSVITSSVWATVSFISRDNVTVTFITKAFDCTDEISRAPLSLRLRFLDKWSIFPHASVASLRCFKPLSTSGSPVGTSRLLGILSDLHDTTDASLSTYVIYPSTASTAILALCGDVGWTVDVGVVHLQPAVDSAEIPTLDCSNFTAGSVNRSMNEPSRWVDIHRCRFTGAQPGVRYRILVDGAPYRLSIALSSKPALVAASPNNELSYANPAKISYPLSVTLSRLYLMGSNFKPSASAIPIGGGASEPFNSSSLWHSSHPRVRLHRDFTRNGSTGPSSISCGYTRVISETTIVCEWEGAGGFPALEYTSTWQAVIDDPGVLGDASWVLGRVVLIVNGVPRILGFGQTGSRHFSKISDFGVDGTITIMGLRLPSRSEMRISVSLLYGTIHVPATTELQSESTIVVVASLSALGTQAGKLWGVSIAMPHVVPPRLQVRVPSRFIRITSVSWTRIDSSATTKHLMSSKRAFGYLFILGSGFSLAKTVKVFLQQQPSSFMVGKSVMAEACRWNPEESTDTVLACRCSPFAAGWNRVLAYFDGHDAPLDSNLTVQFPPAEKQIVEATISGLPMVLGLPVTFNFFHAKPTASVLLSKSPCNDPLAVDAAYSIVGANHFQLTPLEPCHTTYVCFSNGSIEDPLNMLENSTFYSSMTTIWPYSSVIYFEKIQLSQRSVAIFRQDRGDFDHLASPAAVLSVGTGYLQLELPMDLEIQLSTFNSPATDDTEMVPLFLNIGFDVSEHMFETECSTKTVVYGQTEIVSPDYRSYTYLGLTIDRKILQRQQKLPGSFILICASLGLEQIAPKSISTNHSFAPLVRLRDSKCLTGEVDCNGGGSCVNGSCVCDDSHRGLVCSTECPLNRDLQVCSARGKCNHFGVCICNDPNTQAGEACQLNVTTVELSLTEPIKDRHTVHLKHSTVSSNFPVIVRLNISAHDAAMVENEGSEFVVDLIVASLGKRSLSFHVDASFHSNGTLLPNGIVAMQQTQLPLKDDEYVVFTFPVLESCLSNECYASFLITSIGNGSVANEPIGISIRGGLRRNELPLEIPLSLADDSTTEQLTCGKNISCVQTHILIFIGAGSLAYAVITAWKRLVWRGRV